MNKGIVLLIGSIVVFAVLGFALFRQARPPAERPASQPDSFPPPARASLLVYCAAGVKPPALEAAQQYEKAYGVQVEFQYGGSGTLLTNVQVARTGDLYLSADRSYQEIAREKKCVREVLPLARMKPVIVVRKGNPKSLAKVEDLLKPEVRLALGNPSASIGKQTEELLRKAGLWERIQKHVEARGVFKPTVPELANDVKIGAADAAVVWDATAHQYPDLESIEMPELSGKDYEIGIGVLAYSTQPSAALRFARYLNSTAGNEVFRKHGYRAVQGDVWSERPELIFYCGSVNRRAVEGILKAFEEREGVTINAVYNGCGILTAQMKAIRDERAGIGFPDVYMACDRYYLDNMADWFQEDVDVSDIPIVIAVQKGNPRQIRTLKDLTRPGLRIAVGQPQQCTIGSLTRIVLEKEGLFDAVMKNVVTQTASSAMLVPTVTTNSVDVCLAYRTDTLAEASKVDIIAIDLPGAQAVQPVAIAKTGIRKYLSRRLMDAILTARERFESAGFNYRLGRKEPETK